MKQSTFFKCARLGVVSVFAMTLPWSCVGEEPQMNRAASAAQALPAPKPVDYELPTGADADSQTPIPPKVAPENQPCEERSSEGRSSEPHRSKLRRSVARCQDR